MQAKPLNHHLIRAILIWASNAGERGRPLQVWLKNIAGLDEDDADKDEIITNHLLFLKDMDWIDVLFEHKPENRPGVTKLSLKPEGWLFLDDVHEDTWWDQLVKAASERDEPITFRMIQAAATFRARITAATTLKPFERNIGLLSTS